MRKGSVSIAFINDSVANGYITQLAVFMKLKASFNNSCFFKWSYRSVSLKSGISVTTLRKCIPFFLEKGWCRVHCGNLVLNKMRSIDNTIGFKKVLRIEIIESESYRDLIKRMRILLLKGRFNAFQFVKNTCRDYHSPTKSYSYKKAKKLIERGFIERQISCNDEFFMSNGSIGKMFGRSGSTASRLQGYARKKGIITTKVNIQKVSFDKALHDPDTSSMVGLFFINGKALVQRPNFISF